MIALILLAAAIGVILWGIGQFPIDPIFYNVIRALVVVLFVLYVIGRLGGPRFLPGL